jgi:competence protein ComEC
MAAYPLSPLAVAACIGVLAAEYGGSYWHWLIGAVLLLLSSWWGVRSAALLLGTVCVFALKHHVQLASSRDHPLRHSVLADQRTWAELEGRFESVPPDNEGFSGAVLAFCADGVKLPGQKLECRGVTRIKAWFRPGGAAVPTSGGRYRMHGYLTLSPPAMNPSLFRPEDSAMRKGIIGRIVVDRLDLVQPNAWDLRLASLRVAERCRTWIAAQVGLDLEDDPDVVGLLQLMTLGASELQTHHLEDDFRDTGTLHIFSVSGLHVGMIAIILWRLLTFLSFPRAWALGVICPLLLGYAFVTGWETSAARSGIMAVMLLLGPSVGRPGNALNALGAAALILLTMDTQQVFDVGFQLSFFIVWALVVLSPKLGAPFQSWAMLDPFLPQKLATKWQLRTSALKVWLVSALATSVAAWLGGLLFMGAHFHSVTPISIVANLLEVPLSFAALVTATISIVAALFGRTGIQSSLNHANWLWAKLMMITASWFAAVPGGNIVWTSQARPPPEGCRVSVLSLPMQHSAVFLESNRERWLIDTGSDHDATRTVLPFFRYLGIDHLHGTVLSHNDSDHVGGAVSTLRKRLPLGPLFVAEQEPWPFDTRQTSFWKLQAGQVETRKLEAGDEIPLGKAKLRVMYPMKHDTQDRSDDRCLVLQLIHGDRRVLFHGDCGYVTEQALLQRWSAKDLRSDILLADEHSSDIEHTEQFLSAVSPQVMICSGLSSTSREATCKKLGIALMDPKKEGMVEINIEGTALRFSSWITGRHVILP